MLKPTKPSAKNRNYKEKNEQPPNFKTRACELKHVEIRRHFSVLRSEEYIEMYIGVAQLLIRWYSKDDKRLVSTNQQPTRN